MILVWTFLLASLFGPYVSSIPCGEIAIIIPVFPTAVSDPGVGIFFAFLFGPYVSSDPGLDISFSISFWTLHF